MTHIKYSDCYKKVYNEIILDPLYDNKFFTAGTLLNDTIYKNSVFINFRFFYIS